VKEKIKTLLKELICNRCVNNGNPDSGNEIKSALSLKKYFNKYNIKSEILESRKGRANILSRIPGESSKAPSLMYMSHLDVVPANEDEWSYNPFSAEEVDGYIWGRGTVDMLNITACQAAAFAEIAKTKRSFPGDLIFLAVADEEASGRLGAGWLVENHWNKVKTDYMITEAGGFFVKGKKSRGIVISIGEKGFAWTRITLKGVSGHGSMPYRMDNAALKLSNAVSRICDYPGKIKISDIYKRMVEGMRFGKLKEWLLTNPLTINKAIGKLYKEDPGTARHLNAISRMTISPNIILSGQKVNVIPDEGIIELDIRVLPGQTKDDVIKEISKAIKPLDSNFKVEVLDFFPSNISPEATPLFDSTLEILRSDFPGIYHIPSLFSGVTDARFWRMRGTVVYGFALFDESMTMNEYVSNLHGKDERVSLKSLENTYNYFFKLPEVFYRKIL